MILREIFHPVPAICTMLFILFKYDVELKKRDAWKLIYIDYRAYSQYRSDDKRKLKHLSPELRVISILSK